MTPDSYILKGYYEAKRRLEEELAYVNGLIAKEEARLNASAATPSGLEYSGIKDPVDAVQMEIRRNGGRTKTELIDAVVEKGAAGGAANPYAKRNVSAAITVGIKMKKLSQRGEIVELGSKTTVK